jgi:hypothetical protein
MAHCIAAPPQSAHGRFIGSWTKCRLGLWLIAPRSPPRVIGSSPDGGTHVSWVATNPMRAHNSERLCHMSDQSSLSPSPGPTQDSNATTCTHESKSNWPDAGGRTGHGVRDRCGPALPSRLRQRPVELDVAGPTGRRVSGRLPSPGGVWRMPGRRMPLSGSIGLGRLTMTDSGGPPGRNFVLSFPTRSV